MTALLTDNLPLLAGAPNGIQKLRELILELAVRGKLVPQDPSDEPASELLKRIAGEKTRLAAEGKIRKQKPLVDISELEKPYELPVGWDWTTLPGAASYQIGKTPPTKEYKFWDDSGLPWVSISDMEHYGEINDTNRKISMLAQKDIFKYPPVPAGTLLMSFKLTVGKVAVLAIDAYHNEAIISLSPYSGISKDYLFRFLPSIALGGQQKNALMGNTLNSESMAQLLVPIPPLAEQHRIVAKVDELMALCDRLEARQSDAESAHARLVQALLDSLVQASDADDFAASWQRLAEHFHSLFISESSIDALKQTLLQLAVMGKLVPQDSNDEPANELLKRIAEEKARLMAEGKLRKQKPLAEIGEEEKPFGVPKGWGWVRLEAIAEVGTGATPLRTNPKYFEPAEFNWVTSGETDLEFIGGVGQKVSSLALKETNLTVYPPHTLIMAMYGQGKTRGQISELLVPACTNQACAAIQLINPDESHRRYVKFFFIKSYEDIRQMAAGGAQPNLNLGKIKETVLPIPPLSEQHRIVVKLDQLMALCDQLKARLTAARQLHERLVGALVERAVA